MCFSSFEDRDKMPWMLHSSIFLSWNEFIFYPLMRVYTMYSLSNQFCKNTFLCIVKVHTCKHQFECKWDNNGCFDLLLYFSISFFSICLSWNEFIFYPVLMRVCTHILCMYSLSNQFCKTFLYMHLGTDVIYHHMHFLPNYASFYQKQWLLCTNFR